MYRPRDAEHTVLHQVIALHLEAFLEAVAEAGDGAGLPQFVEREFREFLTCGVFEHGVARFQCEGCAREHLVPFSWRSRRSATGCNGCWCAAAWSRPTRRRGRRIGWRTSPPCWPGSSGPRCRGGWRWACAQGRGCGGSATSATRRP
ncbi:MAG: transposase zinc-binding domain-containing protein [Candidatus Rokubacteria bacterium]|nr:transposase zinc-binding domain-containing protein [Candidatus Rokubacteria bacterium]